MAKQHKPTADFPLTAHRNGQWCKKIRGRIHYFGPIPDWQAALTEYRNQKEDLEAGRDPRRILTPDCPTLGYALDRFLSARKLAQLSGELSERSYRDYERTCERIAKSIGKFKLIAEIDELVLTKLRHELGNGFRSEIKRGKDKAKKRAPLMKRLGPATLKGELTRARMVFLYVNENLVEKPVKYRKPLKSPARKLLREAVNQKGERSFSRTELNTLIEAAPLQLKAMIYLGINCGFGNTDCALLPLDKIDLDKGWHTFWRPKTQNPRRCPLWPETIDALRAAIEARPRPKGPVAESRVFITREGNLWVKDDGFNVISAEFRKLMKSLGIYRKDINGFYSLRRTFETIGTDAGHQVATDFIMGHIPDNGDMAAVYRQRISDEALLKVSNFVRDWLNSKTV